jgi:hypothetical protein
MTAKRKQAERLFDLVEQAGAYGTHVTYEPVNLEDETEPKPETVQKLGELAVEEGLPGGLEAKKERFKDRFKDKPWVPRTQYELTLALQGLPIAIDHIAERMARLNQPTARRIYEAAMNFSAQAWRILHDLDDAYVLEGDKTPSTSRIREDTHVRLAVAEHLLAKSSLDSLEWPDRRGAKKVDRERQLAKIENELKNKSSDDLLQDWTDARESFKNEAEFWDDQMMKVQDSPRVQEIQSENRSRRL